jgi:hypothetical protein
MGQSVTRNRGAWLRVTTFRHRYQPIVVFRDFTPSPRRFVLKISG